MCNKEDGLHILDYTSVTINEAAQLFAKESFYTVDEFETLLFRAVQDSQLTCSGRIDGYQTLICTKSLANFCETLESFESPLVKKIKERRWEKFLLENLKNKVEITYCDEENRITKRTISPEYIIKGGLIVQAKDDEREKSFRLDRIRSLKLV